MEEEIEQAEHIPNFLNAEAFITARLKELAALTNAIGESNKVTSIFQRLPKHMRRRAMSHTVKRVPRNLRDAHKRQLQKNNALKKPKKARKRFRKRPKQLLLEYNRRQKTNIWLETHIWHAKRYRMSSKWNYKLAESSYEKTFRASYRASRSHCLIQDMSYYCCIELSGPVDHLSVTLKTITNPACGLSITAKCWLSGSREGNVTLFHCNSYPFNVIGNVTFMWRPGTSTTRTLWLWCHPSFYQEVLDEIIQIFHLSVVSEVDDVEMPNSAENVVPTRKKKRKCDIERTKINLKNVPGSRVPKYVNTENNVTVLPLKDTLNRFRLTGPLSNAVITKALHPAELFDEVLQSSKGSWWIEYRHRKTSGTCTASNLLEKHCSPSLFPPHVILGGNIVDPRLFLKRKKSKAVPENREHEYCLSVPPGLSDSSIWGTEVRDEVSLQKWPSGKLNQLRSELLVPGFDEQLLKEVNTVIPILFVQRPGTSVSGIKLDYGCGWDIIMPANWAMPVWLSLILCGARAGGLRETRTINFESRNMPEFFPDSRAGSAHYAVIKREDEDRYFRKPPNKRTNFLKHGFPTPFHHPWDLIIKEWSVSNPPDQYFVLREKTKLRELKEHIENLKRNRSSPRRFSLPSGSLIPVSITMMSNGQLAPFSHICLPTESDLRQRARDRCYSGPCEKLHKDETKQMRRALKMEHMKELKRLRRKRIKEKKERIEKSLPLKITKRNQSPTEAEVAAYHSALRELWIPPSRAGLRNYCAREMCGFVVISGFSFMQACTIGQGYVAADALTALLEMKDKMQGELVVLTRSPSSLNYRFCRIDVVT